MQEENKIDLFKLLMREQAADWLKILPNSQASTFKALIGAFKQRFALTDLQKWRRAANIWQQELKHLESVDEYITTIIKAARQVPT